MTTGTDGSYLMNLLPPGGYSLAVEAQGFRKLVQSGVTQQTNQRVKLDLTLQLGPETVEVAEAAPLLESQSSSMGNVISQQLSAGCRSTDVTSSNSPF